jgi:hypothetical protein
MIKHQNILPLLCFVVIATFSCKRPNNDISTVVPVPTSQTLNQLFDGIRSAPQTITVKAGRDTMVFGDKGTMLHFYTYSFKTASGAIITSGNVDLQLVEMYKPGDMIRNRATTMAGGYLLNSGGQINLSASMNGQAVYANRYGIGYYQENPNPAKVMELFYGNVKNVDSVVNWDEKDTLVERYMAWPADSMRRMPIEYSYGRTWMGYVFDSASKLEYTNCDAFYYDTAAKVSVAAVMPDGTFTPENTQVYLVLPTINCAMSTVQSVGTASYGTAHYNATTRTINLISEGNTNIVPYGMKYILIVIANKGGQYYYYKYSGDAIPTTGIKMNAIMTPDSKANVLAILSAL